jgi:hypothetical protein
LFIAYVRQQIARIFREQLFRAIDFNSHQRLLMPKEQLVQFTVDIKQVVKAIHSACYSLFRQLS